MGFLAPPIETVHLDDAFASGIRAALDAKTKPPGSLGRLEDLALQVSCVQRSARPRVQVVQAFVFAGDHGVVAQGVSPYPQAVTAQMVANFLSGGAAVCVLARSVDARLAVVDAGVAGPRLLHDAILDRRVADGTRDFTQAAALTAAAVDDAMNAGIDLVRSAEDAAAFVFGEMGIGNTTSAAALMHALTGRDADECVGRGTGADDAMLARKRDVVRRGVARHGLLAIDDVGDRAYAALRDVGGCEIAMMAGAMLGAASTRRVFLVDGFISTAACAAAIALVPAVSGYAVFAHVSAEGPHAAWLGCLGVRPLLDLGLRLGEGSGAMLAVPLLRAACDILSDMATFDSAGVSGRGA